LDTEAEEEEEEEKKGEAAAQNQKQQKQIYSSIESLEDLRGKIIERRTKAPHDGETTKRQRLKLGHGLGGRPQDYSLKRW